MDEPHPLTEFDVKSLTFTFSAKGKAFLTMKHQ